MLTKKKVFEVLGLPFRTTVVFYDESLDPDIHFTEEVLLDFWQMMLELIEKRTDIFGILKPKPGNEKYEALTNEGVEIFNNIKQKCLETGRFQFIDNPGEVVLTEVIAISDINITMGMCSPSTIALLCGKIGLFYETTGTPRSVFGKKRYRNIVTFDNKKDLFSVVDKIIDRGYNPLSEIDEKVLRSLDYGRDEKGVKSFTEALVAYLPPGF